MSSLEAGSTTTRVSPAALASVGLGLEKSDYTGDGGEMSENSRTVAVVKGQLSKFSGIISKDLPKAKQRLVREMIYGIQAAKDVKLSNITRSLNESLPLMKTAFLS
jgi:hypothetical protein